MEEFTMTMGLGPDGHRVDPRVVHDEGPDDVEVEDAAAAHEGARDLGTCSGPSRTACP